MTSLNIVAYERIGLANPVSEASIAALLAQTDLKPGDRAAELGCGNAALAMLLAARGLQVLAVDRGADMAALAARKVQAAGLADRVRVVHGEAQAVAADEGPFHLVSAVGTTALTDFRALASWTAPGGWLLWGDIVWRAQQGSPPSKPGLDYDTDAGWRARAADAGLTVVEARTSDEIDWAAYVTSLTSAVRAWADEHPLDPARPAIEMRARSIAAMYAPENLNTLGFVSYLFRKPD